MNVHLKTDVTFPVHRIILLHQQSALYTLQPYIRTYGPCYRQLFFWPNWSKGLTAFSLCDPVLQIPLAVFGSGIDFILPTFQMFLVVLEGKTLESFAKIVIPFIAPNTVGMCLPVRYIKSCGV